MYVLHSKPIQHLMYRLLSFGGVLLVIMRCVQIATELLYLTVDLEAIDRLFLRWYAFLLVPRRH